MLRDEQVPFAVAGDRPNWARSKFIRIVLAQRRHGCYEMENPKTVGTRLILFRSFPIRNSKPAISRAKQPINRPSECRVEAGCCQPTPL